MAMQPDFDLWSEWYVHMNMTADEVMTLLDTSDECYGTLKEVALMIHTGKNFEQAKATWGATKWERLREIVTLIRRGKNVPGHDKSRKLNPKPSRTELMYGNIVKRGDLMGMELSSNSGGTHNIYRCVSCGYWEMRPVTKEGQPSCLVCKKGMSKK